MPFCFAFVELDTRSDEGDRIIPKRGGYIKENIRI